MDPARPIDEKREPRPIRVLTLTPFYPFKGDEVDGTFVAEPLECLSEFNVESTIIAAKPTSWGTFARSEGVPEAMWVRYPELPGAAAYGSWGLMLYARIARLVKRLHTGRHFDLIHAQAALPSGHSAALLAGKLNIPFVVTIHGLDVFSTRRETGLSRLWANRCSRYVYSRAARNICVSNAVQKVLLDEMGGTAESDVIYSGVNTELFRPSFDEPEDLNPTILSVGRLVPEKGHELVLRAIAALSADYPNLVYEMIDDGPDRSRLLSLADELKIGGRVRALGRLSRRAVAEAMQRCTIFALPSRDEAMGCVYLEAMATAKPIIGCRHQGIEEIVRHGENGLLIQPGNLKEMVDSLSILLKDRALRKRMGMEARKSITESLTLRHHAEQLNRVFRECLGTQKS